MIKFRVIANLCLLLFFIIIDNALYCQNQANNWYIGSKQAGVNFNLGVPITLINGANQYNSDGGTACVSDTLGNLLFYTNGETVWNRNHQIMQNGSGLEGDNSASQPALIVQKPGSQNLYYLFTVGSRYQEYGLAYSIIDMNEDAGNGSVMTKNQRMLASVWARDKLTSVRHRNSKDYWIIAKDRLNGNFHTYLLSSTGINPTPVISISKQTSISWYGPAKFTPDRKKLISCCRSYSGYSDGSFEVCDFNDQTGEIFTRFIIKQSNTTSFCILGCDISPDSKILYVATHGYPNITGESLLQYDLRLTDSLAFFNSCIIIDTAARSAGLQLAPDGKIYGIRYIYPQNDTLFYYLDVIHDVWKRGTACNFESYVVNLQNRKAYSNLPNFPQDLLYRFVWSGGPCAGVPFNFHHRFIPEPDSIHWDFGDPGSGAANFSTVHNPTHVFSAGGTYVVYTYVKYPNGRIEETSREVEVLPKPYPNLGPDTLVCANTNVTLTPGSGYAGYYWNGSIVPGNPTYLASDTGTYIVRVKNNLGCFNADTIRVLQRPAPALNETNLNIAPTTCGGTTGAITGLQINGQPPYSIQWTASGTPISDSLDMYHLGTGLYELHITDGFGCTNTVASYAISDAGNILIDTASVTPAYCGNNDGTLSITAVSGLGSMLQYFIKTGSDTLSQWSNGQFTGLPGGAYYVWVTDSSGCSSVYASVLQIDKLTAPEILTATSSPETGSAADGTITVNALGIDLTYSLNGATPVNTGHFTGLSAGSYSVTVTNTAGCDTTFTISVANESGIVLSAIAGNGFACLGKEAKAPIVVSNFKDVQSFETILNYDPLFVTCLGFNNPHPLFGGSLEVTLPASGKILTRWNGTAPLTLPDSTEIVQLVFNSLLPGNALLLWEISPAISNFLGPGGDTLNVDYTLGTILISNPPKILPAPEQKVCEGELLWVSATVQNGTGPLSYLWQTPTGPTAQESIISMATLADNGLYELIVTDTLQCADTSSQLVTVVPIPVSGFPTNSDTLYFDERIQFEATQGYDSYTWNTGDTTNSILVTTEGWYKVTISTPEGCTTTDSVMMLYAFVPLTMPNAFTPDGDGLNDVFRPVTLPEKITSFSMYIYDRWGQQVFFTNDISLGWDGTINGNPAQIGGYVYVLKYGNPSGAEREKRGLVTVVR